MPITTSGATMRHRCAILDDYQNVALQMADWSPVAEDLDLKVFNAPLGDEARVIEVLRGFEIICLMRERTPFTRRIFENLDGLRLVITSGMRNASIDLAAAAERHVLVCGTQSSGYATAELTWGLILELARKIGVENARLKAGALWQETIGLDLDGKTLGVIGLGRLGSRVAMYGRAFGMPILAWSENLTAEKCRELGATLVTKDELLRRADFVTVHLQLSPRTRGLIGARELALMQPTAFLINTSRGPIVDEAALLDVLRVGRIAGAALDVYDIEPLPKDHPLRALPNAVLTPHLGYVTRETYLSFYGQMVEDIRAFLDAKPLRVIAPT
jgi:phosphoglycerate dehydrogenase-like enzyme